jgi:hypothetical protein
MGSKPLKKPQTLAARMALPGAATRQPSISLAFRLALLRSQ